MKIAPWLSSCLSTLENRVRIPASPIPASPPILDLFPSLLSFIRPFPLPPPSCLLLDLFPSLLSLLLSRRSPAGPGRLGLQFRFFWSDYRSVPVLITRLINKWYGIWPYVSYLQFFLKKKQDFHQFPTPRPQIQKNVGRFSYILIYSQTFSLNLFSFLNIC